MIDTGSPGSVVALFDLDGTLCNARHLATGLLVYQFKKLARIPGAFIYLITQAARLIVYKAGLTTYARVVEVSAPEFARLLKGLGKSEVRKIFSEAARVTVTKAHEETLKLLRWHQEEGHTVILASGGFQPFLQEVAGLLGIDHWVGTALEEVDGCYTGRLAGPFCHGDDRVRLVRNFFEASGFNVNLPSSYAYGDRVQDIPMLEMVGNPVAVYPDKELFTYARERGWRMISASAL